MDKGLNDLLKWSISNSTASEDAPPVPNGAEPTPAKGLRTPNMEALASLMGGPSDAELMQAALAHVTSSDPEITLESRLTALDNLEQLIESLDNANLLSKLGLWTPLLELLGHDEPQIRRMVAWCIGTAVQNNEPSQERLVALGGVERLAAVALGERLHVEARAGDADLVDEPTGNAGQRETDTEVRRKAVYALSSACRNYQPAMDVLTKELGKREGNTGSNVDASDMDAVNVVIDGLREKVKAA